MTPIDLPEIVTNIPYLAIFIAFSVGFTQMIKERFLTDTFFTRIISALSLVGSALLFNFVSIAYQPYYLLLLLSVAVPGVVGLYKEGKKVTTVNVTAGEGAGA